jgi:hypothetical protein
MRCGASSASPFPPLRHGRADGDRPARQSAGRRDRGRAIASGYRAGDQSGIGLPDGFKFDLTGLSGSVPDTLGFVNYLDAQIAASVLAEILNLDSASNGNRALGDTVIGLLQMSWKATAGRSPDRRRDLNVEMVDYNFGEDEPAPQILCTDISRPEVTSEAISALVSAGALTPDLVSRTTSACRYSLPPIEERPLIVVAPPTADPAPIPAPDPNPCPPMPDVVVISRAAVRIAVLDAISRQWNKDIKDRAERSPDGHWEALTDAVMATITPGIDVHIHG